MKIKYKLAIFDFDGTLANSVPWFLDVINDVAGKYRFSRVLGHEVEELRACDAKQVMRHIGVPLWKLQMITHHMRRRMARDIDKIPLFVGVDEMLKRLADRGVTLGIVTSNSSTNVRRILGPENVALVQYFVCGSPLLGKRAKLRSVLRRSGFRSTEAIVIGDEIRDLHAAHAEKMAFGGVGWGFNRIQAIEEHNPEEVFASMDEIVNKVVSQNTPGASG